MASLNGLPAAEAERKLQACCGSRAWALTMAARRPYVDLESVLENADAVWSELAPADWLEAFAAHPRIGESGGRAPGSSEREQGQVMGADAETLAALAAENRRYEARFGHVFLISASGRSAGEVLEALRQRLGNEPAVEVRVAAGEQRKITRLRLERMLR